MPEWLGLNSATLCRTRFAPALSDRSNPDFHIFFHLIHNTVLLVHKDCPSAGLALLETAAAAAAITAVVLYAQLP